MWRLLLQTTQTRNIFMLKIAMLSLATGSARGMAFGLRSVGRRLTMSAVGRGQRALPWRSQTLSLFRFFFLLFQMII